MKSLNGGQLESTFKSYLANDANQYQSQLGTEIWILRGMLSINHLWWIWGISEAVERSSERLKKLLKDVQVSSEGDLIRHRKIEASRDQLCRSIEASLQKIDFAERSKLREIDFAKRYLASSKDDPLKQLSSRGSKPGYYYGKANRTKSSWDHIASVEFDANN